jgi:GTP diphosphokinase / guanosine-3',5'-bis(diphosphate) 3'-diphosphatase
MEQELEQELFATLVKQGRSESDIALIRKAYEFARKAHEGQLRLSQDPYIVHPMGVAVLLAELNCDSETICAGLLHDVLEDCDVQSIQIEAEFGSQVAKIVEGVTKLGKFSFSSREEHQAENFRKLILAIAEDVRVVLVKLADRLHNMRTLNHVSFEKQKEKAQETLEVYAPLANRFGLGKLQWELEDLSLKYIQPEEYTEIERMITETQSQREKAVEGVVEQLKDELDARGIKAQVYGRHKHFYSIWKKMKQQGKNFEELFDILAIRVVLEGPEKDYCDLGKDPDATGCYEVIGIVHHMFKPIPGRFKDYLAMPKPNGYQSLHTAVVGPEGRAVEIQIRTYRMHHLAQYGIAAHWLYKEQGSSASKQMRDDRKLAWLKQLVEWQQDLKDAQEYMATVKMDLFADEVFVFSPKGDVYDLPAGSTPIDFAYRVHTDVGNRTIGARINDRIVPLETAFKNGDIIEIITAKNAHPHMDWLNFAKTHGAKNRIRQWFKKHHRDEHIAAGKQMLEAEIGKGGLEEFLRSDRVKELGKRFNLGDPQDILAAVGYGDISVAQIANRVKEQEHEEKSKTKQPRVSDKKSRASNISSLAGLMHHLSKCCSPVPGEEIIGVVTRGSGIAVHKSDCSNLASVDPGRIMEVAWSGERHTAYPATLRVECFDRLGIAGDILKKLSDHKINLGDLTVQTNRPAKTVSITLIVEVVDLEQLNSVCQIIKNISDVIRVQRQDHRKHASHSANVTPLAPKAKPSNKPRTNRIK